MKTITFILCLVIIGSGFTVICQGIVKENTNVILMGFVMMVIGCLNALQRMK